MSQDVASKKEYAGYEYKTIQVEEELFSFYLDSYQCFGWIQDENTSVSSSDGLKNIKLKRNRKIVNKMELTRLQRNFEACMNEISLLEKSKTTAACIWAIIVGIIGTAFMAGSVFAITAPIPHIILCIILAVPGFTGWVLPCFLYKSIKAKRTNKIAPFIEEKYDEIYNICEKGNSLL